MDAAQLFQSFLGTPQGQQALAALQAKGISADDSQTYLQHAVEAGHDHVNEQAASGGLLGGNPGKSFFAAFAAGLLKGDGVLGSLGDGAEGVIGARVTESLAQKAGIDPATAATVAAVATPFVVSFLKSHLGG